MDLLLFVAAALRISVPYAPRGGRRHVQRARRRDQHRARGHHAERGARLRAGRTGPGIPWVGRAWRRSLAGHRDRRAACAGHGRASAPTRSPSGLGINLLAAGLTRFVLTPGVPLLLELAPGGRVSRRGTSPGSASSRARHRARHAAGAADAGAGAVRPGGRCSAPCSASGCAASASVRRRRRRSGCRSGALPHRRRADLGRARRARRARGSRASSTRSPTA